MIRKRVLFMGLEDTLVPGKTNKKLDGKKTKEILQKLSEREKEDSGFHLVLITGFSEEEARKCIKEFGLANFFEKKHILYVHQEYINSKEEIDKKIYEKKITEDKKFKDEYFKQMAILGFLEKKGIPKGEAIYIGHDIWTEGFYTRRFSQIDFALLEDSLSLRGQKTGKKIKGLIYLKREWTDFDRIITGKMEDADYRYLDNYVHETIRDSLFEGTKLETLAKIDEKANE